MKNTLIKQGDKGQLFVVSAPAGTGKTTLVHKLIQEFPEHIVQSISCTTRAPRKGEIDGKDYVFLTKEAFDKRVNKGEFLEYASVFNESYGTLKDVVASQRETGKHVILVIDTQGALALKKSVEAVFVFIAPPSYDILKERLEKRETEIKSVQEERLKWASFEMEKAKYYDYLVVNNELETAYQVLKSIVVAEGHRIKKE